VAADTWKNIAQKVMETINGYGTFWFEDVQRFKDVGPFKSYKHAVLCHLHWTKDWPAVYGEASMRSVFDRAWR
jgi:hypothetical protein